MSSKSIKSGNRTEVKTAYAMSHSGPLPPAEQFFKYDQALPGAAERILRMAEKELAHRHESETKLIDESVKADKRGQYFAYSITLISLGMFCYFAYNGLLVPSIFPGIVTIASVVVAFIGQVRGSRQQN